MKLEVLLSVMNLNIKDLDKMNITSSCVVINQCGKSDFFKYKNFKIYSYDEVGTSNSRNRGLEHISGDIILLCDDDIVYNKDYEKVVLDEFARNKSADVIIFNFYNPNRKKRIIKKRRRLHFFNCFNYATYNIAFRRDCIGDIKFNTMFGPGARFSNGSDTMFIKELLMNKLKIYSCPLYLGTAFNDNSTWFDGFNDSYFYNKGALFTALNKYFRHFLMFQYLVRHSYVLSDIKFFSAYKLMLSGSKDYLKEVYK